MKTFKEHHTDDIDVEQIDESILKSPVTLFAMLGVLRRKIGKAKSVDDKIDTLSTMLWVNGQLTFNLLKDLDNKTDGQR